MYIHFSLTVKMTEDENKVGDLFFLCFFNGEQMAWPGINFLQILFFHEWQCLSFAAMNILHVSGCTWLCSMVKNGWLLFWVVR